MPKTINEIKKLRAQRVPALVFNSVESGGVNEQGTPSGIKVGWDAFLGHGEWTLSEAIKKRFDNGSQYIIFRNSY